MILDKLLQLSVPQFPHFKAEIDVTVPIGLLCYEDKVSKHTLISEQGLACLVLSMHHQGCVLWSYSPPFITRWRSQRVLDPSWSKESFARKDSVFSPLARRARYKTQPCFLHHEENQCAVKEKKRWCSEKIKDKRHREEVLVPFGPKDLLHPSPSYNFTVCLSQLLLCNNYLKTQGLKQQPFISSWFSFATLGQAQLILFFC